MGLRYGMTTELPPRILVVDDDSDTRSIVSSSIGVLGFSVVEAVDGEDALHKFVAHPPDLVLLDVMMPRKDGIEVCVEMRALPEGQYVPILMLTARDSVKDKVVALDGGADDYLTKPFHLQELQARVRALLRVRKINLTLRERNLELEATQAKLVSVERQLLASELAGATAHKLGQPLSAILLNCHLMDVLPPNDLKRQQAFEAIKADARRLQGMLEALRDVDAGKTEGYFQGKKIIEIKS